MAGRQCPSRGTRPTRHRRCPSSALIAATRQAEPSRSASRDNCFIMEDHWFWYYSALRSLPNFQDKYRKGTELAFTFKTKRGLSGFANGSRISAFPDTGSTRNVVSEAFVRELKLKVEGSPCEFKLGNSQNTNSIGELLLIFVKMLRWLMNRSRHREFRLGVFGNSYRHHEHRLRCSPYL